MRHTVVLISTYTCSGCTASSQLNNWAELHAAEESGLTVLKRNMYCNKLYHRVLITVGEFRRCSSRKGSSWHPYRTAAPCRHRCPVTTDNTETCHYPLWSSSARLHPWLKTKNPLIYWWASHPQGTLHSIYILFWFTARNCHDLGWLACCLFYFVHFIYLELNFVWHI